jgi:hypothetical protein
MAIQSENKASLAQILDAVDHLSPAQVGVLERRLAARRGQVGNDEATLIRAGNSRLLRASERRLSLPNANANRPKGK